jgi:hypothetical protein
VSDATSSCIGALLTRAQRAGASLSISTGSVPQAAADPVPPDRRTGSLGPQRARSCDAPGSSRRIAHSGCRRQYGEAACQGDFEHFKRLVERGRLLGSGSVGWPRPRADQRPRLLDSRSIVRKQVEHCDGQSWLGEARSHWDALDEPSSRRDDNSLLDQTCLVRRVAPCRPPDRAEAGVRGSAAGVAGVQP